ncbi:ABC-ATPase domain-containing protein [Actinoalloteichus fjordicus]|uniref:ATPase of the ABC class n=1 Tax=Actinoalloteichus fjordicus TaxID=1612552 RepID=A0AAC9LD60_9PSEU|nr:ABC-ATPase domain-containing protein [Actinoalloteichus fjordicus]APU14694.1 putative ATPase of the ABC class [Actinoalloteichus fjordicus]
MTRQYGRPSGRTSAGNRGRPRSRGAGGGDASALAALLDRLDGSGYPAYHDLHGDWKFPHFTLSVRRVQADPYAPPSRVEVRVSAEAAGLPAELWRTPAAARATSSHLLRRFASALGGSAQAGSPSEAAFSGRGRSQHAGLEGAGSRRSTRRTGPFAVDAGGPEILDRSAGRIVDGELTLRMALALPAHGRRIDGVTARRALIETLPAAVDAVRGARADLATARRFVASVEDSVALRELLPDLGLVAFVADGAILPRRSGVDDEPMPGALPFRAPESMTVRVRLPHRGEVTGLGVPEGVTVVVGGGYHGKSTLLRALERGVYDHAPGDGRELVVTRADAVKIRAEDGRAVTRVDVSAFLSHLPQGTATDDFSTADASGSTSQAASIVEALEAGSRALLIDEDTAATNIMIRDARMRALVAAEHEPLTPFVDVVRSLSREHRVSTVVVTGGSGDYLAVADRVIMMESYQPHEVTERARLLGGERTAAADRRFPPVRARIVRADSVVAATGTGRRRVRARGRDAVLLGEEEIDVRAVEQLVDQAQLVGVGLAMAALTTGGRLDGDRPMRAALDVLAAEIADRGFPALADDFAGDLAVPRMLEVAAALNRLRTLRVAGFVAD